MVPHSLRQIAVDIAHEALLGIQKTKAPLREKVCFPQIHNAVKTTVEKCITCQAVARPNLPGPLAIKQMPKSQWEVLNIDFYGPLLTGEYLLVVIDRYSRFPEVEIVSSTKASVVIPKLIWIFAVHGIPASARSDNGPPFRKSRRTMTRLALLYKISRGQIDVDTEIYLNPNTKLRTRASHQYRYIQDKATKNKYF